MRAAISSLMLALLCPMAEGQKKGVAQVTEATAAEYAYLQKLPEALGKLGSLNAGSKQFTLLVEYRTEPPVVSGPMAEMQRIMQRIGQQQQQVALSRNPGELSRRLSQLQSLQTQLVRVQNQVRAQVARDAAKGPKGPFKEFELAAASSGAEVRMGFLPLRYDDKGNIKEFTKEELAKLRGKENKPGIPATFEDLQPGQIVKVIFSRGTSSKKTEDPKSTKNGDDEPVSVARPQVAMIIILADSTDPTPPTSTSSTKKKK